MYSLQKDVENNHQGTESEYHALAEANYSAFI